MKNIYLILLLLLISASCTNKKENTNRLLVNEFPVEKHVMLDSLNVEPVLFFIGDMLIVGDYLVTVDIKNDIFFQFFDLPNLNYIGEFVRRGEGPEDEIVIFPSLQRIRKNVFSYRSLDKQKVVAYDELEKKISVINEYQISNDYMNVLNSFLMGDQLLGYDMQGESTKEFISYNFLSKKIGEFGSNYPNVDFLVETSRKNVLFSKTMANNADDSKFVALYDKLPLIRIYDANGNVKSESEFINNQLTPSAYAKNNIDNADLSSLTVNYLKLKVTDNYIYGLYSGKTHEELGALKSSDLCNEIHIWDWSGKPVKRLILNKSVSNFAVSLDDSYIFLYSFEKDDVLYVIR